jgi:hypothetical protein
MVRSEFAACGITRHLINFIYPKLWMRSRLLLNGKNLIVNYLNNLKMEW